ncbi:MAG: hypothetical protein ABI972_15085 [Acidobacteriota bacterium]
MTHTRTLLLLMSLSAAPLAMAADIYHLSLFKAAAVPPGVMPQGARTSPGGD